MRTNKDYYTILGVEKNATEASIKKAYRRLAMKHHPDRNKGDLDSEATFKDVSEAYEVLSDTNKRSHYDNELLFRMSPIAGGEVFNVIFENLAFSFGGGRTAPSQISRDIRMPLQITIQEAYSGCVKTVSYSRASFCTACGGLGIISIKGSRCPSCGGSGGNMLFQCRSCRGTRFLSSPCQECGGRGHKTFSAKASGTIPKCVRSNSVILVEGGGNDGGLGGKPGNLYMVVSYPNADPGQDVSILRDGTIVRECSIPWQAVLSDSEYSVSITGGPEKVSLRLDGDQPDGHQYVFPGMGMDAERSLLIKVFYEIPKKLSKKAKQEIARIIYGDTENATR